MGSYDGSPESDDSEQLLLGDLRSADVTVGDLRPHPPPSRLFRRSPSSRRDSLLPLCSLSTWLLGTAGGDMFGKEDRKGFFERTAAVGTVPPGVGAVVGDMLLACRRD